MIAPNGRRHKKNVSDEHDALPSVANMSKISDNMDLLKWIKSLDDLLFELMSWLVFWPVTLARTAVRPITMMRYADAQLSRPDDEQYDEALSPPVFLVLTLVVAHLSAMALGQPDEILTSQRGVASLIDDDTSAVAVRIVLFAAFPLIFSVILLTARRRKLNRRSLQLPFYAQCYPAAVYAAVLGAAAEIASLNMGPPGTFGLVVLAASVWLIAVETIWLHQVHHFGWLAAFGLALAGMILGTVIVVAAALLLVTPST
ncbi:hypothetical protein [Sphingomonas sp.]